MKQDITLKVGRERDISLEGTIFEPKYEKPDSLIIFTPGISSTYRDYQKFLLEPLAEEARVLTYNLRGHGKSEGKFDPPILVEDLENIVKQQVTPVVLLGQSIGAGISAAAAKTQGNVCGVYMINPYLDPEFLSDTQLKYVSLAQKSTYTGLPTLIDPILHHLFKGFHNRRPIRDFGSLKKVKLSESIDDIPISWIISDKDEVLGTIDNQEHYSKIRQILSLHYPNSTDRSELAQGLNHCLNTTKGDYAPFMKKEKGKDSERIVTDIIEFTRACVKATA